MWYQDMKDILCEYGWKLRCKLIACGHPALGFGLAVLSVYGYPVEATALFYGFLKYQGAEYRQIKDTCYQDIKEFLEGYGGGLAFTVIARIITNGGI